MLNSQLATKKQEEDSRRLEQEKQLEVILIQIQIEQDPGKKDEEQKKYDEMKKNADEEAKRLQDGIDALVEQIKKLQDQQNNDDKKKDDKKDDKKKNDDRRRRKVEANLRRAKEQRDKDRKNNNKVFTSILFISWGAWIDFMFDRKLSLSWCK